MTMRRVRLTLVALIPAIGIAVLLAAITGSFFIPPVAADGAAAIPQANTGSVCDPDGIQPSGALYRLCIPSGSWNGDLVVIAHGYVAFNEPLAIPDLVLPDGTSLPDLITSLGFAFATTSYRTNGLAVEHGVEDLVELVGIFTATHPVSGHIQLTGASEGGIITALAVEKRPDVFDGGLAACGPTGDFRKQIDYFGDFRVLFDYFFPGLIPGDPIDIPPSLIDSWTSHYQSVIKPAILDPANADKIDQLLRVGNAPFDPNDPSSIETTIADALWYNVFGTNDAVAKLGGQPFDNQDRVYSGSDDDAQLNLGVRRVSADPAALDKIEQHYQTSGALTVPLVTLHTTLDQQIPYWHAPMYRAKVIQNDAIALHHHVKVPRYGHCDFTADEVLAAFLQLASMVLDPPQTAPSPRHYLPVIASGPE